MWITTLRRTVLTSGVGLLLAGCTGPAYYWQSVSGHLQMLNAAKPVDEWLADTSASASLKTRLALSQRIRSFAVSELSLPDNPSYRRYADLRRSAVVWNVVAAPELSLKLKTWCFPVTGCVGYRGYFDEGEARAEAAKLKVDGFETAVYGVPAYSTLGWMNWAGGDPLLNTFINYPEGELARLLFHELAHQVVFASGDTTFNESFATAVERLGGQRWLDTHASPAARQAYAQFNGRRQQFRALAQRTRQELRQIYAEQDRDRPGDEATDSTKEIAPRPVSAEQKAARLALKTAALEKFRREYDTLKDNWGGFAGYDPWVRQANNAAFGVQAAYDELVPGFEALFVQQGRDWPRFYDAVKQLAKLTKAERHRALKALAPSAPPPPAAQIHTTNNPLLQETPHGRHPDPA